MLVVYYYWKCLCPQVWYSLSICLGIKLQSSPLCLMWFILMWSTRRLLLWVVKCLIWGNYYSESLLIIILNFYCLPYFMLCMANVLHFLKTWSYMRPVLEFIWLWNLHGNCTCVNRSRLSQFQEGSCDSHLIGAEKVGGTGETYMARRKFLLQVCMWSILQGCVCVWEISTLGCVGEVTVTQGEGGVCVWHMYLNGL